MAARAGGAASEPAEHARLRRAAVHRLRRAARRPPLRRRPRDRLPASPTIAAAGRGRRASEGARHQAEDLPQLRLRAARGLPQGAARHAAGARSSRRPIIVFIDTPAAYPGIESEERGVAEAIAVNLREMSVLEVPIVVIVCGEGGSGGALGIAIGDRVLMQEFSVYSVIPPEGCAAILWRDANRKVEAADGAEDHRARSARARPDRRHHPRAARRRAQRLRTRHRARRSGADASRWRS